MPAIISTSSRRMHGEFLRLLFLQAHRETTAHFTAIGMPAQQHCDSFRFRRVAFYNGLKSKVGLAAAKTAAMRINLNIDGCGVVAPPVHSSLRAPLLLANLLAPNSPSPTPLNSVRWPDSNTQAAASSVPQHMCQNVLLFPSPPPRSQLFHRSSSKKTYIHMPTFLLTTSPSPAPLTSVRWPDSNVQAAAGSVP